jgi:hypothetical protein
MTVEQLIAECNDFIWGFQYVGGHDLPAGSEQHRDLVRTFAAGVWTGGLHADRPPMALVEFIQAMADPRWRPDERFTRAAFGAAAAMKRAQH